MNRALAILTVAELISEIGSRITFVALPLIAVLLLHASALQMGLISAAAALPALTFGIISGALERDELSLITL